MLLSRACLCVDVISIKLQSAFVEIALLNYCFPVSSFHVCSSFHVFFLESSSGGLLMNKDKSQFFIGMPLYVSSQCIHQPIYFRYFVHLKLTKTKTEILKSAQKYLSLRNRWIAVSTKQ